MDILIWAGAALTVIGLIGLIWCITRAVAIKRAAMSDDDMKTALQSLVAWNLGALALSAIGLMAIVMGIALS